MYRNIFLLINFTLSFFLKLELWIIWYAQVIIYFTQTLIYWTKLEKTQDGMENSEIMNKVSRFFYLIYFCK